MQYNAQCWSATRGDQAGRECLNTLKMRKCSQAHLFTCPRTRFRSHAKKCCAIVKINLYDRRFRTLIRNRFRVLLKTSKFYVFLIAFWIFENLCFIRRRAGQYRCCVESFETNVSKTLKNDMIIQIFLAVNFHLCLYIISACTFALLYKAVQESTHRILCQNPHFIP